MSELEASRDDNGQFAPSTDGLFGQEAELVDSGYVPMPDPEKETRDDIGLDVNGGAEVLSAIREDEAPVREVFYQNENGERLNADRNEGPVEAVTAEQAAANLTTYREGLMQIDQEMADAELLAEVGADQPAKPNPVREHQAEAAPEQADPQAQAMQWLEEHPEAHAALSQHVQQSTAAAEQVRVAYAQQLDGALAVARQVTFALIPELNGVTDANHAASVLSAIQQQNPQRFAQIQQLDRDTGQLMAAAQNERQAAAQRELQAVRAYNDDASKSYEAKWGKVDRATGEGVRSYLEGLGATADDLQALANTRLPSWAQKALVDAAMYNRIQNAPKAVVKPDLPPVQRPGVARAPGEARQRDLTSLNGRLNKSGSVDDAFALVAAMRANKR